MRLAFSLFILFGLASQYAAAQPKDVLFTYGSDTVYEDEFVRVFLKNNKKEEQTDSSIKAYLNLYINFKLKVKEAEMLGMDQAPGFQQELAGFREQASRSYMTDTSLTSQLMDEAYERMKMEVNASHILILVGKNALPKDTLKAYNRILQLRDQAMKGFNFDTLALYNSEDPSAKNNYGDLGYFSTFDMIYPFENQAYQTEKGSISPIFRTEYGYHILKVKDKRPYRGEVKVSHLLIRLNPNPGEKEVLEARRKIDSIYVQLKNGADWKTMVTTFSEDAGSSSNSGELNWMRTNSPVAAPFRETAFSLANKGDISQPVLTEYGWHIIRLNEKRNLQSKEEMSDRLRLQVNREPERVKMSEEALVKRFKTENGYTAYDKNIQAVRSSMDSSILKGTFKADQLKLKGTPLFKVGNREVTSDAFAAYMEKYQSPQKDVAISAVVDAMLKDFTAKEILQYEKDHLEEKYPDFKYLMQEYHDGILLFNLTEQLVWNKAVEDTTGLKAFYELHKTEYAWNERAVASIYECSNKEAYTLTKKLLKKKKDDVEISQEVNKNNPLSLVIKKAKFEHNENVYVDQVKWKPGTYTVKTADGKYILVRISEVLPAGPKAFNEVKGLMTGKYQDELERDWVTSLKAKYPVAVNEATLESLMH